MENKNKENNNHPQKNISIPKIDIYKNKNFNNDVLPKYINYNISNFNTNNKKTNINFNSHMNNVRYVELLMDVHDTTFYDKYSVKSITLNYMKELKEKEAVEVYTDASIPETISVCSNEGLSFLGKVTFVNN